jgi:hypothetical protein
VAKHSRRILLLVKRRNDLNLRQPVAVKPIYHKDFDSIAAADTTDVANHTSGAQLLKMALDLTRLRVRRTVHILSFSVIWPAVAAIKPNENEVAVFTDAFHCGCPQEMHMGSAYESSIDVTMSC